MGATVQDIINASVDPAWIGVAAELVTMPDAGHGWSGEKAAKTQTQAIEFFKEKLKKK